MSKAYSYDWKTLIDKQQTSGMNIEKFCIEKGSLYQSFKSHKYILESESSTEQTFVPVKATESKEVKFSSNRTSFILIHH